MSRHVQFPSATAAIALVLILIGTLLSTPATVKSQTPAPAQGYGVAVADITAAPAAAEFGFSWVKSFLRWDEVQIAEDKSYWWGNMIHIVGTAGDNGLNLLLRIDGAPAWVRPDGTSETGPVRQDRLDDWADFLYHLAVEASGFRRVNGWTTLIAYEIWNEPNLSWEWGDLPPDPAHYTAMLKTAYQAIKVGDPDALVVSGGLATTGGTPDGLNVNDLTFIQEMYQAGARRHFDALGSHPYGFAYPPEQDPATVEGLAFRHAEQQHAVMAAFDDAESSIWATGFSWLMDPAERGVTCHWPDRDWQKVSEAQQADYLVRAFTYARQNWPWMGPMLLTGLDLAGLWYYDECEPMAWYAVADADANWHPRAAVQPYDQTPRLAQEALIAFLNPPPSERTERVAIAIPNAHPHYGITVGLPNIQRLTWASELDVGWVRVYGAAADWPSHMLRQIPANWEDYDNLKAYCAEVKSYVSDKVDAYEIGNKPNLDWAWSEGTSGLQNPDPVKYSQVLKTAYTCIKEVKPEAIVVSGGLSIVGPYDSDADPATYPQAWNDLKFLQALYDAGAQDYFDALGSHLHGFGHPPEKDPAEANGLAFRRAEQQREIMIANGDGDKQIWATEWGWLLRQESCRSVWEAEGRWWQTVDEATQADYVRRALEYARANWPWMGPTFLFNLDLSMADGHQDCDVERHYAILHADGTPRPAYTTLRDMPKWPRAVVTPDTVNLLISSDDLGVYTRAVQVDNLGAEPLTYTVSTDAAWLTVPDGVFTGSGTVTLAVDTAGLVARGSHCTALMTLTTNGSPSHVYHPITVTVRVADEILDGYLPLVLKEFHN